MEVDANNSQLLLQIISAFAGAFFAFIFFVIGQLWISSNKKRRESIRCLKLAKNYIIFQLHPIEINKKLANNILEIRQPIMIHIKKFHVLPIEYDIYSKIDEFGYRAGLSVSSFISRAKILNENIDVLNSYMEELSDFARIAMLEKREREFEKTMDENLKELHDGVRTVLQSLELMEKKINPVTDEIYFSLWYTRSYFWQKIYFKFRQKSDKHYREKIIKEKFKKNEKRQSKN